VQGDDDRGGRNRIIAAIGFGAKNNFTAFVVAWAAAS
jgi:hypothetical protein